MIVVLLVSFCQSSGYLEEFQRANTFYLQNDFVSAARSYERLLSEGVKNPVVYFNLGNTYYRLGKKGYAIANYERALWLAPGFDAALQNLETVVAQTKQKLERPKEKNWLRRVVQSLNLTPKTSYFLAFASWVFLWIFLGVYLFRSNRYILTVCILLVALSLFLCIAAWVKMQPPPIAVACQDEIPVRYGAGDNEPVRFMLQDGDRVLVEQTRNGWVLVRTPNDLKGWSTTSSFVFLSDQENSNTVPLMLQQEPRQKS